MPPSVHYSLKTSPFINKVAKSKLGDAEPENKSRLKGEVGKAEPRSGAKEKKCCNHAKHGPHEVGRAEDGDQPWRGNRSEKERYSKRGV